MLLPESNRLRLPEQQADNKFNKLHPTIRTLFESDGIGVSDLSFPYALQENGFQLFVHGSGITNGKLDVKSDIDFTVVGDLLNLTDSMRATNLEGIDDTILNKIDYISLSNHAQNGRKLSYHLQNASFRTNYPDIPFASEFRKSTQDSVPKSKSYILGGINSEGNPILFRLQGTQINYDKGVVSMIPQTGIFDFNEEIAYPTNLPAAKFKFEGIAEYNNGWSAWDKNKKDQGMVFGLELNKLAEDTPFNAYTYDGRQKYVVEPLQRSLDAISDYGSSDPIQDLATCLQGRAKYRESLDGRARLSDAYLETFTTKLQTIQRNQRQF